MGFDCFYFIFYFICFYLTSTELIQELNIVFDAQELVLVLKRALFLFVFFVTDWINYGQIKSTLSRFLQTCLFS